jgi:glycine hydroxymethyltransferase
MKDLEALLDLLIKHERGARTWLNLVPSESWYSADLRLPFLMDAYHRYSFNDDEDPNGWDFRGVQEIAGVERELVIPLLRNATGAEYVSVKPLSGLHVMLVVLASLAKPGATVFTVSPGLGGHMATASLASRLGLRVEHLGGTDPHTPDLERLAEDIGRLRPTLLYVDQGHGLFPFDIASIVTAARSVDPAVRVHVDVSHWLGLILGGAIPNPLTLGADSIGGSTHKTFPGPHKGLFATNDIRLMSLYQAMEFAMVSNHNFAAVISLAFCLLDFRFGGGATYATSVVANARALGEALASHGLQVAGAERGYSDGHQLWVRTQESGVPARAASQRLYEAGIRVNCLDGLPGIPEPALRLGVSEATWRGFGLRDMAELAELLVVAVLSPGAPAASTRIRELCRDRRSPFGIERGAPGVKQRFDELWDLVRTGLGVQESSPMCKTDLELRRLVEGA